MVRIEIRTILENTEFYSLVRQLLNRRGLLLNSGKFLVYLSVIVAINAKCLYFCTPICKTM